MTRKILCSLLCSSSLLLASPDYYGICAAIQSPQSEAVPMSSADLTTLRENSRAQEQALNESAQGLETARAALSESNRALSEARKELAESQTKMNELRSQSEQLRKQLTQSQTALTISQQEALRLSNELTAQRQEISLLKQRLIWLGGESENAESALKRANESLQNTRLEFRKNEEEHARREVRLKNQITVWQIIAVVLGGIALSK